MKFWMGLGALLILAGAVSAETVVLTRAKAVSMAVEQNESYQAAQMEKDRVQGQYLEARAGAFPRLTFDAGYLRTIDKQTTVFSVTDESTGETTTSRLQFGEPHSYSAGFTLYQPLYVAGKVGAAIQIAKYGFSYADEGIRAARHDVVTLADRAYLDAVAAREAQLVFIEAEQLADSNMAVVEQLFKQGQASEYDFLRAQVQAANTRPARIAAENGARLALDYLRVVLALPKETDITLEESVAQVAVPELNLDALIDEALQNRPELRQSEQMMKINKKLISIEKGGHKPTIGLSSSMQWDGYYPKFSSTRLKGWTRSWNVGVSFSVPIFTGFETKGKIQQARVDYNQSRLQNSQLNRQIRLEVRDAVGKVKEAKQRVEALGETVDQAKRGYDISQVRYQNGIGTQLEVQDAQVALTQARVNKINALHDLAVAVTELRRAVGREWDAKW
ncbi:MAG: TolC family protein [Candidatus Zixiibacteriota bacterium]